MKNLYAFLLALLLVFPSVAKSQDSLKINFRSRALMDAMVSGYGKDDTQGYFKLEDFRAGFKAKYGQFELLADVGISNSKVRFKDLLFTAHFKNGILAFGNTYDPFSMDIVMNTADLRFNQSAASALAFSNKRRFGLTYHYPGKNIYAATGLYSDNDINDLGSDQRNAYVSTTRVAWRNGDNKKGSLIHIGAAATFITKEVNTAEPPTMTIESDGITSMFPEPMMTANVTNAGWMSKQIVELLYLSQRFMLQGEYFLNQYHRTDGLKSYNPYGGYIQLGMLLSGRGFDYDHDYGIPGRPLSAKATELFFRVNHTNLNDGDAGIFGGKETDYSLGVNFYFNRYLGFKVNGSYIHVGDHCNSYYADDFFLVQTRFQYIF